MRALFARRGFVPASDPASIEAALQVAEDTLGGELVPASIVAECEARTGRCFYVRLDETGAVEGFIALLFLSETGFYALMRGAFDPASPRMHHLTDGPDERASAIYVWCLAARSDEGRRALVRAVTEARRRAFADIALFARPVSREGRMMTAALDAPNGPAAFLGWVPTAPGVSDQEEEDQSDGRLKA
ncbi:MAG: hypothetical protein AAFX09_07720 [Pseudomonadota bacterium]